MGRSRSSRSPSRKKSSRRRSTPRPRSKHSKRNRHRSVERNSTKYRRSDSSSDSSSSRYKSSSSKQKNKTHRRHDSRSPSHHRRRHRRSSSSATSDSRSKSSRSRSSSSSSPGNLHKNKPSSSYIEKIRAMRTPTPPRITFTTNLDFLDRKPTTDAIDEINLDKFVQKTFSSATDVKPDKDLPKVKGQQIPKINKSDADDDPLFHKNVR